MIFTIEDLEGKELFNFDTEGQTTEQLREKEAELATYSDRVIASYTIELKDGTTFSELNDIIHNVVYSKIHRQKAVVL